MSKLKGNIKVAGCSFLLLRIATFASLMLASDDCFTALTSGRFIAPGLLLSSFLQAMKFLSCVVLLQPQIAAS
ncbi:hypothetical protein OWV82_022045 [Melia azedarach]|uniref:Uncharacterized protein n=1 Tax=Melia azedarach TaxID=155640 RepID=A0ACC1X1N9_MELAZ|nr:hypothetical protein OWV82_022045 [Melia azedarach]